MAKPTKRSNAPLFIIAGVLIIAVLGGWWLYSSAKPGSNTGGLDTKPSATTGQKTQAIPPDAPQGANPPNQFVLSQALSSVSSFAAVDALLPTIVSLPLTTFVNNNVLRPLASYQKLTAGEVESQLVSNDSIPSSHAS